MIRRFIGNQMGPRQFEFPPNILELDSAGRYSTWNSCPSKMKVYGSSAWTRDMERIP